MPISLNGREHPLPAAQNLSELIRSLNLDPSTLVAEVNGQIVPASAFDSTILHSGDTVEILNFVGGG